MRILILIGIVLLVSLVSVISSDEIGTTVGSEFIASSGECGSIPIDACEVTQDTIFEPGTYNLPNGIQVAGSSITLDCNGAVLRGGGGAGISITSEGWHNTIKNCFINNYNTGISISGGGSYSSYNNLTNNVITGTITGISITYSYHNILKDNIINQSSWSGIRIGSVGGTSAGNLLINNTVDSSSSEAGFIINSYYDSLINNTAINNLNKGFVINSFNITLIGNAATNNQIGLYIGDQSGNHFIFNNSIYDNDWNVYSSIPNVFVEYNWWNTFDPSEIESKFNRNDIDYDPYLCAPYPTSAISPCIDSDGDKVVDSIDNCLTIYNPDQTNSDTDSFGNACDSCWYLRNPNQVDSNGDCPTMPYITDPECGDVCSIDYLEIKLPTRGWYMIGSSSLINVSFDDVIVWKGSEVRNFSEAANIWIQDPIIGFDSSGKKYFSAGLLPIDDDHYLRVGYGYWLSTNEDNLRLIIPNAIEGSQSSATFTTEKTTTSIEETKEKKGKKK